MILLKLAPSGSRVKKGDIIAQIDAQSAEDHIEDVTDTVKQAGNDIHKREAEHLVEMGQLELALKANKATLDKMLLELKAAEVRTTIDQELIKLAVDEAEAEYKRSLDDIGQKKLAHAADIKILGITEERHKRHLDRHLTDLRRFTIRAPMDGLAVYTTIWRGSEMGQVQEGDQVNPGQGFMKIVDSASMQVEGTANQAEITSIRVGQPAIIELDAFPGTKYTGKVHTIGALAAGGWRQSFFIRTVPVKVLIDNSDSRVIPDLSASANVVVDRAENAIVAPLSAIKSKDGKDYVAVRSGEAFEEREVQLGLRNDTHAAVLGGLSVGEVVRIE
jgi:multidrug efflux pump subunit AcrA (membrane-fusion protein)